MQKLDLGSESYNFLKMELSLEIPRVELGTTIYDPTVSIGIGICKLEIGTGMEVVELIPQLMSLDSQC